MKEIRIKEIEQLNKIVRVVLDDYRDYRLFAFFGELGTGKTTAIQAICKELNMQDVVNSPTFSIVNEYWSKDNRSVVYHFDFYRIEKLEEVYDFGYEEYFYSGNYCFLEWPELVKEILPQETIPIYIEVAINGERVFRFGK